MTTLHKAGLKLSDLATEVHKLNNRIIPFAEQTEIRLFFLFRHYTPLPLKVNKFILDSWEPRASKLIMTLKMVEYEKLRAFLGVGEVVKNSEFIRHKDDEDNASTTIRTEDTGDRDDSGCGCGCQ